MKEYVPVAPRNLRVTRTLVIEGPESWVRRTLEMSQVKPEQPYEMGDRRISEAARVEEVVE
jgi:hypothetical protein